MILVSINEKREEGEETLVVASPSLAVASVLYFCRKVSSAWLN
jgi:hypothetical protein